MNDRSFPMTCRVGMFAAAAVILFAIAYAIVLALGFLSLDAADEPIGDPWFSVLELLIIAMMPALVTLMAAIHMWSPARAKVLSLSSLVFMGITASLTVSVHFTILALEGESPALSFRWPSVVYALDIVAWDLFFPLSMLFAAPVFDGDRLQNLIRVLMIVSGLLALAGLSGVAAGDMRLRDVGILGYAGVFPVATALMAVVFRLERQERAS